MFRLQFSSMNFGKCIHPCKCHPSQDINHFPYHRKFLCDSFQPVPYPRPSPQRHPDVLPLVLAFIIGKRGGKAIPRREQCARHGHLRNCDICMGPPVPWCPVSGAEGMSSLLDESLTLVRLGARSPRDGNSSNLTFIL